MSTSRELAPFRGGRIDKPLNNLSIAFTPEGYICNDVLTYLSVNQWSGIIGEYGTEYLQLVHNRVLSNGVYLTMPDPQYKLDRSYIVHNHGIKGYVTERLKEEVEDPFMARADVNEHLDIYLMTEKEFNCSQLLRAAASFGAGNTALSGNARWDSSMSDPVQDVTRARKAIWEASKKKLTHAIIPYDVFLALQSHPKITNFYGSSGDFKYMNKDRVAAALGIKAQNIFIPEAVYETNSGTETTFWGKDVILYNQADSTMKKQRTWGYRLSRAGHDMRTFVKDAPDVPNSEIILKDRAYNYMIVNPGAAFKYTGVVS